MNKSGPLLLATMSVVTAILFALSKWIYPASDIWQLSAQITGISGLFILSWTYILSIRHVVLERMFGGLDRVYKLHSTLGGIAFLLLLHHPLFLILRQLPANTLSTYLLPFGLFSYSLGIYALYAMLTLMVLTLYVDMPYRLWKQTHEWMGIVIMLGGLHGLLVPSDMSKYVPLTVWMVAWSIFAIGAFMYKRYLYYHLFPGSVYILDSVTWNNDIVLITLVAEDIVHPMAFGPGQFGFLAFDAPGKERDEHPFSLVSQEGPVVRFGIKVTGGFTLAVAQSAKGTRFRIHGPFGAFGSSLRSRNLLWIAGGIGVTPFIPLIQTVTSDQQVTFIFTVRGTDTHTHLVDMIRGILPRVPQVRFIVHDTISHGRLTAEKIAAYDAIQPNTKVWLCGPQPMMSSLTEQLHARGIARHHIYFEDFSFR